MKPKRILLLILMAGIFSGCAELMVEFTAKILIPFGVELFASPFAKPKDALKCEDGKPKASINQYIDNYAEFATNFTQNFNAKMQKASAFAKKKFDENSEFIWLSKDPNYGEFIISLARKSPFRNYSKRAGLYSKEEGYRMLPLTHNKNTIKMQTLINESVFLSHYKNLQGVKDESIKAYCENKYFYEFITFGGGSLDLIISDINEPKRTILKLNIDKNLCEAYIQQSGYCK